MTHYTDEAAKMAVATEAAKRNAHISRFHPCRWKALWSPAKNGWHVALRPYCN